MPKLKNLARPKEQRDDYRFFEDGDTAKKYKAALVFDEVAGRQPVVKVSVSEVGADGHALIGADGLPLVSWHSHTFTEAELVDPEFTIDGRIAVMLDKVVENRNVVEAGREKVGSLADRWKSNSPLQLDAAAKTK